MFRVFSKGNFMLCNFIDDILAFHSKIRPSMLTKFQMCVACVVCVIVTCRVRSVFVVYIVLCVTYLYLGNHTTHKRTPPPGNLGTLATGWQPAAGQDRKWTFLAGGCVYQL